jgi:hypothetical protein
MAYGLSEDAKKAYLEESGEVYVDKTGKADKPNPLGTFLEFPWAMAEIDRITSMGAKKHAPKGWTRIPHGEALPMFRKAMGRHILAEEIEGAYNWTDVGLDGGPLLHPGQAAWNALAYLEHWLRRAEKEEAEAEMSLPVKLD